MRSSGNRWKAGRTQRSAPRVCPRCVAGHRASPNGSVAPPTPIRHPSGQTGSAAHADPPRVDVPLSMRSLALTNRPNWQGITSGSGDSTSFRISYLTHRLLRCGTRSRLSRNANRYPRVCSPRIGSVAFLCFDVPLVFRYPFSARCALS